MSKLLKIITPIHLKTKRDYFKRMKNNKIQCMKTARKYNFQYWDGKRKYGYGGYKYIPNLMKPVAQKIIKHYKLTNKSKILDVGCGKGFVLYEIKKILPKIKIAGFDISKYGIRNSKKEIKKYLFVHRAQDKFPYKNKTFDLVFSIHCLHNLQIFDLMKALQEIQRVGKAGYVALEGYRHERELFNLQCWALTAESFFTDKEWIWIYDYFGYKGDYEFIYFK